MKIRKYQALFKHSTVDEVFAPSHLTIKIVHAFRKYKGSFFYKVSTMNIPEKSASKSSPNQDTREIALQVTQPQQQVVAGVAITRDDELMQFWTSFSFEVIKFAFVLGLSLYATNKLLSMAGSLLDSINEPAKASGEIKKALSKRLKRPEIEGMTFDAHELKLLNDIIGPDEIDVTFNDIGGMEAELEEVKDNVVLPMQLWNRFRRLNPTGKKSSAGGKNEVDLAMSSGLASCPTGVLLYGLPGTGKSLTARAIAKGKVKYCSQTNSFFISMRILYISIENVEHNSRV